MTQANQEKQVLISTNGVGLEGNLCVPAGAQAIILFAHGSGSSRFSPRNNFVANILHQHHLATLLTDLLTAEEDRVYENRFNIGLLTQRLAGVAEWIQAEAGLRDLPLGLFGASTGAACALRLAALPHNRIYAVVSRGGRPDLAEEFLSQVTASTLLIVGGDDDLVLELNEWAYRALRVKKELAIVPGATHLFEEPGALEEVAFKASEWFAQQLPSRQLEGPTQHCGARHS